MPREEPVVAFEILGGVLMLAVNGLVQFLDDFRARRFGSGVMRIDVVDEHSQGLRATSDLRRTSAAGRAALA